MVSSPLGLLWLLVKPSYIGIRMAGINYTVHTALSIVALLTTSNCRTRQKSGCCQRHREQADSVTSRLNQHPLCICLPGVSSSVCHMFEIAEKGNEVRCTRQIGFWRKGKYCCAPFVPHYFYFFKISLWPLKAKCSETPNELHSWKKRPHLDRRSA